MERWRGGKDGKDGKDIDIDIDIYMYNRERERGKVCKCNLNASTDLQSQSAASEGGSLSGGDLWVVHVSRGAKSFAAGILRPEHSLFANGRRKGRDRKEGFTQQPSGEEKEEKGRKKRKEQRTEKGVQDEFCGEGSAAIEPKKCGRRAGVQPFERGIRSDLQFAGEHVQVPGRQVVFYRWTKRCWEDDVGGGGVAELGEGVRVFLCSAPRFVLQGRCAGHQGDCQTTGLVSGEVQPGGERGVEAGYV